MRTRLSTITAPTVPAIPLDVVADHLRLDADTDAHLVALYAEAAVDRVQGYLGRALINQRLSWTVALDVLEKPYSGFLALRTQPLFNWMGWNRNQLRLELPRSPVSTIHGVSLSYWDGTSADLDLDTEYEIDTGIEPARVRLLVPSLLTNCSHIRVVFTAGYGDTSDSIPASIRNAILVLTTHLNEHRGDTSEELSPAIRNLLASYRAEFF